MEEDSIIHSGFAFIIGEDPAYKEIEGAWLDNSTYGTIHRIASDGTMHHVFNKAVNFCSERCAHIIKANTLWIIESSSITKRLCLFISSSNILRSG